MASRRLNCKSRFTLHDVHKFSELTGYSPVDLVDDEFVLKPVAHAVGSQALAGKEAE